MVEQGQLKLLDPSDKRWVTFIAATPQANNIFYHPAWSDLIARCYGYRSFVIALCSAQGEIAAGLPMLEVNSPLTGKRWVSLPFTDHCAPLYDSSHSLNQLTSELIDWFKGKKTPPIELRWPYPPNSELQLQTSDVLHTIDLSKGLEATASRLHPMHLRNIKTAERKGVQIEFGQEEKHLDSFYRLHLATRQRQGIPIQPRKFFDLLEELIIKQGLGFVLIAYKGDIELAAAVFLHWRQTLTYKYGASSKESLALRPNNLLFWTAIRWGCENGYTTLDLGKTDVKNIGLQAFKSNWGAEEIPLTYTYLSTTRLHPTEGTVMGVMQWLIRSSPSWVCKTLGECLYGHFG